MFVCLFFYDQGYVNKVEHSLTTRDMQGLDAGAWLNDNIIDFSLQMIMQSVPLRTSIHKFFCTTTFFWDKLERCNLDCSKPLKLQSKETIESLHTINRWINGIDLFGNDFCFIPMNNNK